MWENSVSVDPETLEACPYDNSHMIRRKRMQYHLMKCRKNHAGRDFATCPFNACHEMPRPELRYHIAHCPDKAVIEKDLAYEQEKESEEGNLFKGCTDVPAYNSYELSCNEDWDTDVNPHPRIGVDDAFMQKVKFKNITGMTPSEKRYFHRTLNPEHIIPEEYTKPAPQAAVNKENHQPNASNGQGAGEGKLRLPKNAPKAFSMYQDPKAAPAIHSMQSQQVPSTVFAYSLAQCGLGRGRGVGTSVGRGVSVSKPGPPVGISSRLPSQPPTTAGIYTQPLASQLQDGQYKEMAAAAPAKQPAPPQPRVSLPPGIAPPPSMQVKPVGRGRGVLSTSAANQWPGLPGSSPDTNNGQWPSLNGGNTAFNPAPASGGLTNGNPSFVVPKVSQSDLRALSREWCDNDSTGSGSGSGADLRDVHGTDVAKKRKKLQKKLRQIEALEEKVQTGVSLTTEEEIKVGKKDDICEELEALNI